MKSTSNSFSLNSVTVFGGSGFLGRHLVRRLAKTGARIQIACRHPKGADALKPCGDVGQITAIPCPTLNPHAVAAAIQNADGVVNLTGILYESRGQTFEGVHHMGAQNIAQAARDAGVRRLVHISAIGADLGSPARYATSKARGEAAVRGAFEDATILRPSVVFGPEDQFFNTFARMVKWTGLLPVIGDGSTKFQPVYVGDVADAIMAALGDTTGKLSGKTYELGGPEILTFKQCLERLCHVIQRSPRFMPIPIPVAKMQGFMFEHLPGKPMITRDQVRLLERDNVVGKKARTLENLGITPTALDLILPTYLDVYRPGGARHSRKIG